MINCEICKIEFKQISNTHLFEHGIDKIEYKKLFPKAKLKQVWNLGLDKNNDKRVLKNSINTKKNHWSKNESREEICKKIGDIRFGKPLSNETKQKLSTKFKGSGNPNYNNNWSDKQKEESSKIMKEKYQDQEYFEKFMKSHWSNNKKLKQEISKKHSIFMSEAISSGKINVNTGYKTGWFKSEKMNDSFYYMSSYELIRMELFEKSKDVLKFTNKHGIVLEYEKNGKKCGYVPDILITFVDGSKRLEEIKGYIRDECVFALKNEVANKFCDENDIEYKLVFKKNLDKL